MADDSERPLDLLGDPWTPPRDPRGRKRAKHNRLVAENIAVLRAAGHTVEAIALRVGISEPTLRRVYFRELEQGPTLAKQVLFERQWQQAMKGSTSAARWVREELEKGEAHRANRAVQDREKAAGASGPPAKASPLGKKEQRQLDAEGVTGRYAPPAPPRLIQ